MKDLYLKDLLNLTEDDVNNSKIALNMYAEKSKNITITAFQMWDKSTNENDREVYYSYWSHYGNQRNFKNGQLCFGFVQLPNNNKRWLLVTVGKIIDVPNTPNICDYEEVNKYSGFLGRLIVELDKGNTYNRYVFNLSTYLDKLKVVEILSHDYQKIQFNGYENVQLSYYDLRTILESQKYIDYKKALSHVKGIYCLTDTNKDSKGNHLYIGSAYGEQGLTQRWECYIDTNHGGNKALIDLYNAKGNDYFEKNFKFTLLEYFGMSTDKNKILDREEYWKKAFDTRIHGLNCN